MEKFFISRYSTFILIVVGLCVGLSTPLANLQIIAATVGMSGLVVGMTNLAVRQYREGKTIVPWVLNTLMLVAVVLRGVYLLRTGQYWLAIPDVYGIFIMSVVQLQLAGCLLRKPIIAHNGRGGVS